MAKHYDQYCPVAHALELVGERWSLLVVRELLGGRKRYTDLAGALPGIGTNILANRLRGLEDAGVVQEAALAPTCCGRRLRAHVVRRGAPRAALRARTLGREVLGPPTPKDNLAPGWLVNAVRATCTGGCVPDRVCNSTWTRRP